jgi:hypothetical protein
MSTTTLTLLVVALLVVIAVVVAIVAQRRKSAQRRKELRGTFGSEYDRTVEGSDKRSAAERELAERKERHDALELRPLSSASRQRYLTAWDGVQSRFVDKPVLALTEADQLVTQVMAERGYPTDGTRVQEDMLSVESAALIDSFRAGHAIEQANHSGSADTEQVRQGMLHFRTVFEALLDDGSASGEPYPDEQDGRRQDDAGRQAADADRSR